jgi:protein-tyrosine phosphatase
MTANSYSRDIALESVINFRDLGGYRTHSGKTVVWRRLFRSGDLNRMTGTDFTAFKQQLGVVSVIDLRSRLEVNKQGAGPLSGSGIKYYNISFIPDGGDKGANELRYKNFTSMGEFYLDLMQHQEFGGRIVEALELIALAENHPLVFHCAVGKDRTGILAAVLLNILGVPDDDVIEDYALSAQPMKKVLEEFKNGPHPGPTPDEALPDYFWEASRESMALFLSTLKREYGSIQEYLLKKGASSSLVPRLEKALLE